MLPSCTTSEIIEREARERFIRIIITTLCVERMPLTYAPMLRSLLSNGSRDRVALARVAIGSSRGIAKLSGEVSRGITYRGDLDNEPSGEHRAYLQQRSALTSNERYVKVRSAKLTSGSMKYVMNYALSHPRRVNKSDTPGVSQDRMMFNRVMAAQDANNLRSL